MPIAGRMWDLKGQIWHCLRVLLLATILVVRAEDGGEMLHCGLHQ
jgi:hypothetical protein